MENGGGIKRLCAWPRTFYHPGGSRQQFAGLAWVCRKENRVCRQKPEVKSEKTGLERRRTRVSRKPLCPERTNAGHQERCMANACFHSYRVGGEIQKEPHSAWTVMEREKYSFRICRIKGRVYCLYGTMKSGSRAWVCPQSHRTLATIIVRQQGLPSMMSTMLRP